MATSLFEYDCEAVRVHARRLNPKTGVEEQRKFSVDPNLTTFNILKSILMRAFDIIETDCSEMVIYFCSLEEAMDWMPLLSDWDLDMAILSSTEPSLSLLVAEKKVKKLLNPLDVKKSSDIVDETIDVPQISTNTGIDSGGVSKHFDPMEGAISHQSTSDPCASSPSMFTSLKKQMEKTLPGITNKLNRVFTAADESLLNRQEMLSFFNSTAYVTEQNMNEALFPPLSEKEFRTYLNKVGELTEARDLRLAVYQKGADPALRKVVWKHILGIYPLGLAGKDRVEFVKRKCNEYEDMKHKWTELVLQGRMTDDLKYVSNMIKKDVLRTDRHLSFYSGDNNTNVNILYNVLTTYALNHPTVGYCQGMSDLLSPLLVVMRDEGQAYLSFCALMSRMAANFRTDGKLMTTKFDHLSQSLLYYDPEFYAYLKLRHADDLLFCYRWLLIDMKREFSFEDACLALEVLWSSLPPPPHSLKSMLDGGGVPLFEQRFRQPKYENLEVEKERIGSECAININIFTPLTTKFPSRAVSKGSSESCFVRDSNNSVRAVTAFSNIVSIRKRVSSAEGVFQSLSTGSSLKGARSLVVRSRRIQSAGSAEDIIKSEDSCTNKSSLGKTNAMETCYPKSSLESVSTKKKDGLQYDSPKEQYDDKIVTYSEENDRTKESICISHREEKRHVSTVCGITVMECRFFHLQDFLSCVLCVVSSLNEGGGTVRSGDIYYTSFGSMPDHDEPHKLFWAMAQFCPSKYCFLGVLFFWRIIITTGGLGNKLNECVVACQYGSYNKIRLRTQNYASKYKDILSLWCMF